ncbi:MAG: MnmC family methyltransferase [Thiovulaceae bacterium]|nr:MnmC family methyltransferase [Sulfurimonadaceae bacterium]
MTFDTAKHTMVKSEDGSFTAYSSEFEEHYHSTRDGALQESLCKHVIPAFEHHKQKDELCILDICFGLGFNTLATLYYVKQQGLNKKLRIFSPEFDAELIASLKSFTYPEIFVPFLPIIEALSTKNIYEDDQLYIELYVGDAREYLRNCSERFDIVYQDAFSPSVNPILWTKEYFHDIARLINDDGILTTYSMALKTRLALHENGFNIYLNKGKGYRDATVASKSELTGYEKVDMAHKIACNREVRPLTDSECHD